MLHQGLPGEHLARPGGQEADQVVLPLGQVQGRSVLEHGGPVLVHPQALAQGQLRGGLGRGDGGGHRHPADVGLHPGQELPVFKGLDDIVVRPQLQAPDLVVLLLPGGEHDDGHGRPGLADLLTHVKAAHPRQHQVQQHQIRVLLQGQLQAGGAVQGFQGIVALLGQVEGQNIHNTLLVLYDQDLFSH